MSKTNSAAPTTGGAKGNRYDDLFNLAQKWRERNPYTPVSGFADMLHHFTETLNELCLQLACPGDPSHGETDLFGERPGIPWATAMAMLHAYLGYLLDSTDHRVDFLADAVQDWLREEVGE